MKTDRLRINQLSPAAYDWYRRYLAALDAKDIERYLAFLDDDCEMVMNNLDPVRGKAAIRDALSRYWAGFGNLEHDLANIYGTDSAFMLEALNHYTRPDGRAVTLRAVALTDRDAAGRVTSFRLYSDTGPLFASETD